MNRYALCLILLAAILARAAGAAETSGVARGDVQAEAKRILDESGVKAGLVVQVPCGDGALGVALGANQRLLVQGLDGDAQKVEAARHHLVGEIVEIAVPPADIRHAREVVLEVKP